MKLIGKYIIIIVIISLKMGCCVSGSDQRQFVGVNNGQPNGQAPHPNI